MKIRIIRLLVLLLAVAALLSACDFSVDNPLESVPDQSAPDHSGSVSYDSSLAPEISLFPLPDESEESVEEDTVIHFLACGDNLIHPSVYFSAMERYAEKHGETCTYQATNEAGYDFLPIYENVADVMKAADVLYINQETLSGGPGTKIYGYPTFNSPEAVDDSLKELGVDIVNIAHNHMLDAGNDSYLIHTNAYLKSIGLTPIGYYSNEAETNQIVVTETKGVRIAWLSYVYATNLYNTGANSRLSQTYVPYFSEELIRRQVAIAKQSADLIIVSAHWGNEYSYSPNSFQKQYADLFCDLGVDVVIGMHPHCIQPMEWRTNSEGHRMLLTYSIGNFVSGMQEAQCVLEGMLSFDARKHDGTITIENALLTPLINHYTKEKVVDSKLDTGYRNFKLYYLTDYTEDLAAQHGVHYYEKRKSSATLYNSETGKSGANFSIANMIYTVKKVIPAEFLPEEYRN